MAKLEELKVKADRIVYRSLVENIPLWLIRQMRPRYDKGWEEHKIPLLTFCGRDMGCERHEELLDALFYQQAVEMEGGKTFTNFILWWTLRFAVWYSDRAMREKNYEYYRKYGKKGTKT